MEECVGFWDGRSSFMGIPRQIHYFWFGKKPLTKQAEKCIASWKKYCPDYEIIRWDEENFPVDANDYVREAYESEKWAFVTDYGRLRVLYDYGGIYMDTDVELLKPLDMFLSHRAFTGFEDESHILTAVMGAEAGSSWIGYLMEYYRDIHFREKDGSFCYKTNVEIITEMTADRYPVVLNNQKQMFGDGIVLYPKEVFCPKDYATGRIRLTKQTVCIHHFSGSWHTTAEQILMRYRGNWRVFGYIHMYAYLAADAVRTGGMKKLAAKIIDKGTRWKRNA